MRLNLYKTAIQTFSGHEFNLIDPTGNIVEIRDIGHALSCIGRYCGQARIFYAVAQHCVQVSYLVPKHMALMGLLHDAGEAYVGDVAKPLKELLPDYKAIEARIEEYVLAAFGIDAHSMPPEIKIADIRSLVTEQRDLMHGPDPVLMEAYGVEPLPERIRPLSPRQAEKLFMNRYYEIIADMSIDAIHKRSQTMPALVSFGIKGLATRLLPSRTLAHASRWGENAAPLNASAQELIRRSFAK